MKKQLILTLCLIVAFSTAVFAAEGNPHISFTDEIQTLVEVGPYANVFAQRVIVRPSGWWYAWAEGIPGMNFGHYTGQAGYGKLADSNAFVLETNTNLIVTFSGQSLTHQTGDKMLTRYWAWTSRGYDDLPKPYLFVNYPDQIQPYREIGYFGEAGKAPRKESGRDIEQIIFGVLEAITGNDFWPTDEWEDAVEQQYTGITTNGIYAFQVFGFASTDEISSQREGDYTGKIILTVAK